MRKLVTIRTINELNPIVGADAIEVATVDGWKLVVKKGEFNAGDTCVYFEIDSFLPKSDERYSFIMRSGVRNFEGVEGHKLRTIKLRGQISQGLALPVTLFPEIQTWFAENFGRADVNPAEMDFSEMLGIKKWEPNIPANMVGQVEGLFPSFIRKTDQERCQNIGREIFGYEDTYEPFLIENIPAESIQKMIVKGDLVERGGQLMRVHKAVVSPNDVYEVTLKLDGTSVTYYKMDWKVGACSRNLELKVNDDNKDNAIIKMFIESNLMHVLNSIPDNVAIQGELMGPGIQGNREGFKENRYFIFEMQDLDNGVNYTPEMRMEMMKDLYGYGVDENLVQHAPIIGYNCKLGDTLGIKDIDGLLSFAEGKSINHAVREGVVFKRKDGKFSFKAISNKYLEKEKD